ncbi:hypothetical protein FS837_005812, partial [Tulasnella sp. UAMH 9824]
LRAAHARRDYTASPSLPPSPPIIADNTTIAPIYDGDPTPSTSDRDQQVEEGPIGNVASTELAPEVDKVAADEEIAVQHTNAADIQKITSYNPRKRSVHSGLAVACVQCFPFLDDIHCRLHSRCRPGHGHLQSWASRQGDPHHRPSVHGGHPIRSMTVSLHPLSIPPKWRSLRLRQPCSSRLPELVLPLLVPLASAVPPPPRRLATSRTRLSLSFLSLSLFNVLVAPPAMEAPLCSVRVIESSAIASGRARRKRSPRST